MTTVYFVRHAQSDRNARDDRTRPLTPEGLSDAKKVTRALADKGISHILSSPYLRAVQTVSDLSEKLRVPIETDEDLRERNAGGWHGEKFLGFVERQWSDFSYKADGGECLDEVRARNITALRRALAKYEGESIAIATHGTALCTIMSAFDPGFGFDDFMRMIDFMPYVVRMDFDSDGSRLSHEEIFYIKKEYQGSK